MQSDKPILSHLQFFIVFICLLPLSAYAQYNLEFHSFEQDQYDITARMRQKADNNGDPTALLKVFIPRLKGITEFWIIML